MTHNPDVVMTQESDTMGCNQVQYNKNDRRNHKQNADIARAALKHVLESEVIS